MANFPLINEASLVMASGAYKEGKIYSQLPTDGSGDFTFTRGTDTATRVNKDGYIEKERGNLLLQSNSFNTSPWGATGIALTGGQEGYDGTNDAWLLSITFGTGNQRLQVSGETSVGVITISAYVKQADTSYFRINSANASANTVFDLSSGTIVSTAAIDATITSVGNDWYRVSASINKTAAGNLFLYVGDSSQTSGSIYIQDAQLEQGLVATDYIETTTAPVYAGLADNMPRLDYSGGAACPSLLLEPQRVNLIGQSEYIGSWGKIGSPTITTNYGTSPEGIQNSTRLEGVVGDRIYLGVTGASATYTYSIYAKGSGIIKLRDNSGNYSLSISLNSEWKRYDYSFTASFTNIQIQIASATADAEIWGAQIEQGSYPTSYIPTYGSSQTRAADVPTVSKTLPSEGSLFINVGGTSQPKLSVLGEYFDASTTANKVAIAYSSTALVISHNGSIVVDKTGTYDVSSLTQIQLGHSNGADQADSPISEFVTFDSFLTNNELNALTQ